MRYTTAIDQQIAITGAVDQFGYVQPIGGVNEKIEGFFDICEKRGLTGNQGVIIPMANVRHLCTKSAVVEAVKKANSIFGPLNMSPKPLLYSLNNLTLNSKLKRKMYTC